GWDAGGSAAMMLTWGVVADDGNRGLLAGLVGNADAAGPTPGQDTDPAARAPAFCHAAMLVLTRVSNGRSARFALTRPVPFRKPNAAHCCGVQPSRVARTCATMPNRSASIMRLRFVSALP